MNGKTASRLREARKALGTGSRNRNIVFASAMVATKYGGDERPARVFTATGVATTPEKLACRTHRTERPYGEPCGQCK